MRWLLAVVVVTACGAATSTPQEDYEACISVAEAEHDTAREVIDRC